MSFTTNRIIFFLLSLPFFSLPTSSFSQKSISSSYIITLEGDTLYGSFDISSLTESPEKIGFKTDLESSFTFYDPTQVRGFSLNTLERYVSHKVDINTAPIAIEKISTDTKDPVFNTKTVFIQVLGEGRADLYGLLYKGRWHYFIEKKEIPIEELILTRYISYREGEKVSTYDEQYKRRLRNLFSDSEEIFTLVPLIDATLYKEKSLVKLVIEYNKSFNELNFEASKIKRTKISLGISAGVSINTLDLTGEVSFVPVTFENLDIPFKPGFQIGAYLQQQLYKSSISLLHEVQFRTANASGESQRLSPIGVFIEDEIEVDFFYLDFNNLVRKKLDQKESKQSIFLEAGVGLGFLLKDDNSWLQKVSNDNFMTESGGSIEARPRTAEKGYLAGIGFDKDRVSAGLRYRFGTGFLKRSNGRSFSHIISLLAAYDLK